MDHIPIEEAVRDARTADDYERLSRIKDATPPGLRGAIRVLFEYDRPVALEVDADAPLDAMYALQCQLPDADDHFIAPRTHTLSLNPVFSGEEFGALLYRSKTIARQPRAARPSDIQRDARDIHIYYRDQSHANYLGSYSLGKVRHATAFKPSELLLIDKITAQIPEDLRDCFQCDVVRRNGRIEADAIAIAPNVMIRQLGQTLLKPIVEMRRGSNDLASEQELLQVRYHGRTRRLDRAQLLTLAETLPAPGHACSKLQ